jgi:hypothetical protein
MYKYIFVSNIYNKSYIYIYIYIIRVPCRVSSDTGYGCTLSK